MRGYRYFLSESGETLEDAREIPGNYLDHEHAAEGAREHEFRERDGWELGTSPLTVTVVAPDGVESQWVTMVETEPVFTAMEADQ